MNQIKIGKLVNEQLLSVHGIDETIKLKDNPFLKLAVLKAMEDIKTMLGNEDIVLPNIIIFSHSKIKGIANHKHQTILINRDLSNVSEMMLTYVVMHELAHLWFGAKDTWECPLMHPVYLEEFSIERFKECQKIFKRLYKHCIIKGAKYV